MQHKSKAQWNEEQSKLYKDPRWQKKRLEIFNRDKFTCQFCQSKTNTLAIHHLEYHDNLKPWEYKDEELLSVCEDCHKKETEDRKITEKALLKMLKNKKFSCDDLFQTYLLFYHLNKNISNLDNIKIMQHIMTVKKYTMPVIVHFLQLRRRNKIKELLEK